MKLYNKKTLFLILVVLISATILVHKTEIEKLIFFEPIGLFTFVGVLLGFSITIYTFSLSLVDSIKDGLKKVNNSDDLNLDKKLDQLFNGFKEMKENIIFLFCGIISIFIVSFSKKIVNPYIVDIEKYQIPDILLLSTFILCNIVTYDLIKTMFNIAEIKLTLAKKNKI